MEYRDLTNEELSGFADFDNHEKVRVFEDKETGLKAFIGVHNSNLGPALGGCRFYPYSSDEEAITDVLRLSRGMTYKNALAGLPLGGGKSVIVGNPAKDKTDALMQKMGEAVDSLDGLYITAEDSGTNEHDMIIMSAKTQYVTGIPSEEQRVGGDPSPYTALGVYAGMKQAVKYKFGHDDLGQMKISIQGLGAVGYDLCRRVHADGAKIIATDINQEACNKAKSEFPGLEIVSPDKIFSAEADIFAPCAMGAALNDNTIPDLKVSMVVGAANNQLATPSHEQTLADKNILYTPDYLVNAGGVTAVAYEYFRRLGQNPFDHDQKLEDLIAHVEAIGKTLNNILTEADQKSVSAASAADNIAESIFNSDAVSRSIAG